MHTEVFSNSLEQIHFIIIFLRFPQRRVLHRVALWIEEPVEGQTPLVVDLLATYAAHKGLIHGRSPYIDTNKSVIMLSLNS